MRTFRQFLSEVLLNEQPPLPGGGPMPGGPPGGAPGLGSPAGLPGGAPPLGGGGPPLGGGAPPMGGMGGPPMGGMGGPPMGGGAPQGGIVKLPELDVWKILSKLLSGEETKKK